MSTFTSRLKAILTWLDNNFLFLLSILLLLFIPLYPKIPLAEVLPGYIVRLRAEDLVVGVALIFWVIWFLRGKVKFDFPLRKIMIAYLIIGAVSILSNIFITHWIPATQVHIFKAVLHLIRYAEYFFLAFLLYSSCQTKRHFQIIIGTIFVVVLAISVYGWGQKYLYWPVFSTMNREFSKGAVLYLTDHARVQSTFGGHYDFAAYLVLMLPFTFIFSLKQKKWWLKVGGLAIHFFGLWALITAASRISFGAYFVSLLVILLIYAYWAKDWLHRIGRLIGWGALYGVISLAIMLFAGDEMIERLVQVFGNVPVVQNSYQQFNDWKNNHSLAQSLGLSAPDNGVAVSDADQLDPVLVSSDVRPVETKPGSEEISAPEPEPVVDNNSPVEPPTVTPESLVVIEETLPIAEITTPVDNSEDIQKPADVYVDVPDYVQVATIGADGQLEYQTVEQDRTWSENSYKYGLSTAIRLDSLWPWAIKGFLRNPLVGSGYGTLNKDVADLFTEADSTDNNFLRTLGETGLLGFITFYSLIVLTIINVIKAFKHREKPFYRYFALAFFGALVGILINAVYIDVFASSKIAFTIWSLVGIFYALIKYYEIESVPKTPQSSPKTKSAPVKKKSRSAKK